MMTEAEFQYFHIVKQRLQLCRIILSAVDKEVPRKQQFLIKLRALGKAIKLPPIKATVMLGENPLPKYSHS